MMKLYARPSSAPFLEFISAIVVNSGGFRESHQRSGGTPGLKSFVPVRRQDMNNPSTALVEFIEGAVCKDVYKRLCCSLSMW
jgi:hypothetical protein